MPEYSIAPGVREDRPARKAKVAPGINPGLARSFVDECRALGVTAPRTLEHAFELQAIAEAFRDSREPSGLLDLAPDAVPALVTDLSIRRHAAAGIGNGDGLTVGLEAFKARLWDEVRVAVAPELDRVAEDLRPLFDAHAGAIEAAAQRYGFTLATTPTEVLNRADEGASAAWRDLQKASARLVPIVQLRKRMCEVFHLSPGADTLPSEMRHRLDYSVNYSVCFAAGDNWSLDTGFVTSPSRLQIDWLALAVGGLRLNTPSEVDAKLATRARRSPDEVRALTEQAAALGAEAQAELDALSPQAHGAARIQRSLDRMRTRDVFVPQG